MSQRATDFRPLVRMGWGGRAASDFRGLVQSERTGEPTRSAIPRGQVGSVIFRSPGGLANFRLSGVTRDSGGALLAGCRVELFLTSRDVSIAETISDGNGAFAFDMPGTGPFFLLAYKAGSPDVAGTTVNTLMPAPI